MAALLVLVLLMLVVPPAPAERPPFMSPYQREIVANIEKAAAPASAAATAELLEALDSPALRATLADCCPQVATLPAAELLVRFEAEASVAEITHNIQARTPRDWRSHYCINCADAELDQLNNHPPNNMTQYLPNMYELALLNVSNHFDLAMTWVGCQTVFETSIFGFKPFSRPWPGHSGQESSMMSWPANWAEAVDRPKYQLFNLLKIDAAAPKFGPIALVMNRSTTEDAVFLTPLDSGFYTIDCNRTYNKHGPSHRTPDGRPNMDCTAWGPLSPGPNATAAMGTLTHLRHLVLANARYYNGSTPLGGDNAVAHNLAVLFSRMFGNWTDANSYRKLDRPDSLNYWEANIAGAPQFPSSVSHIIASFPELYGTDDGVLLRKWAASFNWPILWALGPNGGVNFWAESTETTRGATFLANSRVLDVCDGCVAAKLHNLSKADLAAASTAHDAAWHSTVQARATAALGLGNRSWWSSAWSTLRSTMPRSTHLAPLTGTACARPTKCVGVDPDLHCVCVL